MLGRTCHPNKNLHDTPRRSLTHAHFCRLHQFRETVVQDFLVERDTYIVAFNDGKILQVFYIT